MTCDLDGLSVRLEVTTGNESRPSLFNVRLCGCFGVYVGVGVGV